jgi:DNA polymerase III epsilon subunit-like protein
MIDPASTRFIAIDTETTGLDPRKGARLTEIAAVTVLADRILEDEVFQ